MTQRLAVIIGINYEIKSPSLPPPEEADRSGLNPLRFAEADAHAMAGLLRDQGFEVLPLLGADATRHNIVSAISRRNKAARDSGDLLIVYFAGHGEVDEDDRAYLLPVDFDPEEPDATALRLDNLARDYLDRANSSLTLLDCCHSGYAAGVRGQAVFASQAAGTFNTVRGRLVLAACAGEQKAREFLDLEHGAFTHYALEHWRSSPTVTDSTLFDHIAMGLRSYATSHGVTLPAPVRGGMQQGPLLLRTPPPAAPAPAAATDRLSWQGRQSLLVHLTSALDDERLEELCFILRVDVNELGGVSRGARIRRLIELLDQSGRGAELKDAGATFQPPPHPALRKPSQEAQPQVTPQTPPKGEAQPPQDTLLAQAEAPALVKVEGEKASDAPLRLSAALTRRPTLDHEVPIPTFLQARRTFKETTNEDDIDQALEDLLDDSPPAQRKKLSWLDADEDEDLGTNDEPPPQQSRESISWTGLRPPAIRMPSIPVGSAAQPVTTKLGAAATLRGLRGYYTLPALQQQGLERRLGRGVIRQVIPLDNERVLVIAAGGAGLFAKGDGRALWEIDCPTSCGTISPDRSLLALGGVHDIYLWDVHQGQMRHTLQGHTDRIESLAFAPDGQLLASGSADTTVRLWLVGRGVQVRTMEGHLDWIRSVAFAPNGQLLASGSDDSTVRLWRVSDGAALHTLTGHASAVYSVTFASDGQLLAAGARNGAVWLWRMTDSAAIGTLEGHTSSIRSVAFAPDGQLLASGSDDSTVRLWRVSDGAALRTLAGHTSAVCSVAFAPDGQFIASGAQDSMVRLWRVRDASIVRTFEGHTSSVRSVAFAPDGQRLAAGSWDDTVQLWQVSDGTALQTLQGPFDWIRSMAFARNGQLFASESEDRPLPLQPVFGKGILSTIAGRTNVIVTVALAPDGKLLATGSWNDKVQLWRVRGREVLCTTLEGHTDSVCSLAFAPDGQLLASGSVDKTVRLWLVDGGQALHSLQGHTDAVWSVAFAPDGHLLASASWDGTIRLWRVE